MNEANLETLLVARLGLRKVRRSRGWFHASCPFEGVRHSSGRDDNPSFGVRIASDRSSSYNCKGCGIKGDNLVALTTALVRYHVVVPVALEDTFWWIVDHDNSLQEASARQEAVGASQHAETRPSPVYDWKAALRAPSAEASDLGRVGALVEVPFPAVAPIPESDLDSLRELSPEALGYLDRRRILLGTARAWELGTAVQAHRLVIPIRDHEQQLVGITGRLLSDRGYGPKYLHSKGFKKDLVLYGEARIDKGRPGYAMEGFFDVLGMWQDGYTNAVGLLGSYAGRTQIDKLVAFFTSLTVVGDGDTAGRAFAKQLCDTLRPRMPVRSVDLPDNRDPHDLSTEEKRLLFGPPDR